MLHNNKRKNDMSDTPRPISKDIHNLYDESPDEEIINILNKTKRRKEGILYNVQNFDLDVINQDRNRHVFMSKEKPKFGLLSRYYNETYENDIDELETGKSISQEKKVVSPDSRLSRGMTIRECMNFMDNLSI